MKKVQIKELIKDIRKDYLMPCRPKGVEGCASCEARLVIDFLKRHIKYLEEDEV